MKITVGKNSAEFSSPVTVLDTLRKLAPDAVPGALGCFCAGKVMELGETPAADCTLAPITFADEEGRRINERTLCFVLLMAVKRLLPSARVRIEHSIGYGLYLEKEGAPFTEAEVRALEADMGEIVRDDLPFTPLRWTHAQAIKYYTSEGRGDKFRLLASRPIDYYTVYQCGGMTEYFYGAMPPSTGYASAFKLRLRAPGAVMQMPSPKCPGVPAPYAARLKYQAAFTQSNYWCNVLNCSNVADLNDLIARGGLRDFIRVNEALHNRSLAETADCIKRMNARAIFVAGPSSSGKTTFSNLLCIHLRVLGLSPVLISLDDFYLNRSDIPPEEDGSQDLEALSALDTGLFHRCIADLLEGRTAPMPRFDFKAGKRLPQSAPLRISEAQTLVIEGIHGLNPALSAGHDPKLVCKVYVSELTCLNLDDHNRIHTTDARLMRRVVRDHLFRGTSPQDTLSRWGSVRRGEEKWIFPFQEQADIVFNSVLHYELPLLKGILYDLLMAIPEGDPTYYLAQRLLKILNNFLSAPADTEREIPPLSILREFIGGCTLYE
jgi:uridine kinase